MCRFQQGFLFHCPRNDGGCGREFFQVQKIWTERGLIRKLEDAANLRALQKRNAASGRSTAKQPSKQPKQLEPEPDPKFKSRKSLLKTLRRPEVAVPRAEEPEIVAYFKAVWPHEYYQVERASATDSLRGLIQAMDPCSCQGPAVSMWDYFDGQVFTKHCTQCWTTVKKSSGKKKKKKHDCPVHADEPRKLPRHRVKDPRWLYDKQQNGRWHRTADMEFMKRSSQSGDVGRSYDTSEAEQPSDRTRSLPFAGNLPLRSLPARSEATTALADVTDVSGSVGTSRSRRSDNSSALRGRREQPGSGSEDSEMYDSPSERDRDRRRARSSASEPRPGSVTSSAVSALQRVAESNRHQQRRGDEQSDMTSVSGALSTTTHTDMTPRGVAPSRTGSGPQSMFTGRSESAISSDSRTDLSRSTLTTRDGQQSQSEAPSGTILEGGTSVASSQLPCQPRTLAPRTSTTAARGAHAARQDNRHVKFSAPGESGDDERALSGRDYRFQTWMSPQEKQAKYYELVEQREQRIEGRKERRREDLAEYDRRCRAEDEEEARRVAAEMERQLDRDREADDESLSVIPSRSRRRSMSFSADDSEAGQSHYQKSARSLDAAVAEGARRRRSQESLRAGAARPRRKHTPSPLHRKLRHPSQSAGSDSDTTLAAKGKQRHRPKQAKRREGEARQRSRRESVDDGAVFEMEESSWSEEGDDEDTARDERSKQKPKGKEKGKGKDAGKSKSSGKGKGKGNVDGHTKDKGKEPDRDAPRGKGRK